MSGSEARIVYEPFMSASPRRKVRVGDRVSASQGVVTIPEVKLPLELPTVELREGVVTGVEPGGAVRATLGGREELLIDLRREPVTGLLGPRGRAARR